MVPHLRGLSRPPRRRGRSRARPARRRSGLPLPARRPDASCSRTTSRSGPQRRAELDARARATAGSRSGPWYVQPDSLLPSGEAHVRNLLHGRRGRGARSARCRASATCPTPSAIRRSCRSSSPASASTAFVYWRGNGDEIDAHRRPRTAGSRPTAAPSRATLLRDGYFNAACLPRRRRGGRALAWRRRAPAATTRRRSRAADERLRPHAARRARRRGRRGARATHSATPRRARPARRRARSVPAAALPSVRGELARRAAREPAARRVVDAHRRSSSRTAAARRCSRAGPSRGRRSRRIARARPTSVPRCASPGDGCCRTRRTIRSAAARSTRSLRPGRRRGSHEAEGLARRDRSRGVLDRLAGPRRRAPHAVDRSSRRSRSSTRRRTRAPTSCACRSIPIRRCACRSACRSSRRCCSRCVERAGLHASTAGRRASSRPTIPSAPRWLPGQPPLDVEFVVARRPGVRLPPPPPRAGAPAPDDDRRRPRDRRRRRRACAVGDDGTLDVRLGDATYRGLLARRGPRRPRRQLRLRSASPTIRAPGSRRRRRGGAGAIPSGTRGARRRAHPSTCRAALDRPDRERATERPRRARRRRRGARRARRAARRPPRPRRQHRRATTACGCASRPAARARRSEAATTFDVATRTTGAPDDARLGAPARRARSRTRAG